MNGVTLNHLIEKAEALAREALAYAMSPDFYAQIGYDTDFDVLFDLVREVVASHPKVLSGDHIELEERPDCEIKDFGDSGINLLVEYWMDGIDDGRNRVGADLNYMILQALRENNIAIPFPQREVRVVNELGYFKG